MVEHGTSRKSSVLTGKVNQACISTWDTISKNRGRIKVGKGLHDHRVQPILGATFALKIIRPEKATSCLVPKSFLIPDTELYKANQADKINFLLLNKPQYSGNPERVVEYLRVLFASELMWRSLNLLPAG